MRPLQRWTCLGRPHAAERPPGDDAEGAAPRPPGRGGRPRGGNAEGAAPGAGTSFAAAAAGARAATARPAPPAQMTDPAMLGAIRPPPLDLEQPASRRAHERYAALCSLSHRTAALGIEALQAVTLDAPPAASALLAWKGCLLRMVDDPRCPTFLAHAIALAPRCPFARLNRAMALLRHIMLPQGSMAKLAADDVAYASRLGDADGFTPLARAWWLVRMLSDHGAARDLDSLLQRRPISSHAYAEYATATQFMGEHRRGFAQCFAIAPHDEEAWKRLVTFRGSEQAKRIADFVANEARPVAPGNTWIRYYQRPLWQDIRSLRRLQNGSYQKTSV